MIKKAFEIARKAHYGQVDKCGVDYIEHPKKVASLVEREDEKIVAYLHDVVEDSEITLDDLRNEGFSEEIIFAIDCITKRENESLDTYLHRVILSPLAYSVKLADMTHNSDINRYENPGEIEQQRSEKYKQRKALLIKMYTSLKQE